MTGNEKYEELDEKTVELLKQSFKQQGELLPVIKDQEGHILSGRHRKAANPNWRETTIMVTDELDRLLKIIHFNVQRRPSQEETVRRLSEIAKILESTGVVKSDIVQKISEIVPYSERWIRELLPDEYKRKYETKPQIGTTSELPVKPQDMPIQTEPMPDAPQAKEPVTCSNSDCQVGTWFPYRLKDGRVLCRHCFETLWKQGKVTKDDLLPDREIVAPSLPEGYVRVEELLEEPAEPLRKIGSEQIEQATSESTEDKPTKTLKVTVTMEPFSFYEKSAEPLSKEQLMPKIVDIVKSRSLDDKFHVAIEEEDTRIEG